MDRDFYNRTEAAARQAAIDKELATRRLLRDAGNGPTRARKEITIILRAAPVSIIMRVLRRLGLVT